MKEFDLAALGNWLNGWVQPDGAFYGFHNHSVWKDRPAFGRDMSWTGEPGVVDESYHWDNLPVFVLADRVVTPLRPLRPDVKIYNFSPYEVQGL